MTTEADFEIVVRLGRHLGTSAREEVLAEATLPSLSNHSAADPLMFDVVRRPKASVPRRLYAAGLPCWADPEPPADLWNVPPGDGELRQGLPG